MNLIASCALFGAMAAISIAQAAPTKQSNIYSLMLHAHLCADAVKLSNIGDQVQSLKDIERDGPKALAEAGKNQDLRAAVKEYYAAASAYCSTPSKALEAQMATKESALELELKTAGK